MRAVIQRVSEASVKVDQKIVGAIGSGLLILLGIEAADSMEDIEWLSNKITNLRIFNDADGVMNCSLKQEDGDALVVSQFTLHAKTKKGNRPSYIHAADPSIANPLYESFCETLSGLLLKQVERGVFGAHMELSLINDGPVTILIDTKNRE